jgi:GTP pyrophosphokinase
MKRRVREADLNEVIGFLCKRLDESEVPSRVIGRAKHLYSIYQKMVQQGKDFSDVHDVQGIRIITQTESGCYNALGVVHSLWTPVPGRLKDYIAMPKLNMYRGIHTTVMRENGCTMEVQIRSEEMDRVAREGVAAHWVYKEGNKGQDKKLEDQLTWLRQMYEWLKDATVPEDLMDSMRADVRDADIYVFTPKGEVKELPKGATPLDFAYFIHSQIGHQCIGARVNGRMVPLRYHLQTGDLVEILTSKNQTPHMSWLEVVVTGRARTRIRQRLREMGELEPLSEPAPRTREVRPAARLTHARPVRQVDDVTRHKLIRIEGSKGMLVQFGKCCNPMPGHSILGYVTRNPGITVHRVDCRSFMNTARDPKRIVDASWEGEGIFETSMRVTIGPRPNVLADMTNALRPLNIEIINAQYGPGDDGWGLFEFIFEVADQRVIEAVIRTLRTVAGVTQVAQVSVRERSAQRLAG